MYGSGFCPGECYPKAKAVTDWAMSHKRRKNRLRPRRPTGEGACECARCLKVLTSVWSSVGRSVQGDFQTANHASDDRWQMDL